jgi:hypothetical protein
MKVYFGGTPVENHYDRAVFEVKNRPFDWHLNIVGSWPPLNNRHIFDFLNFGR